MSSREAISPTFIVSSGRSGTTLLRGILNASSTLYIPHESDFLARAYPFYQTKKEFTPQDYKHLVKFFKAASQENGWGMDEAYLIKQLKAAQPTSFSEVNQSIYSAYLKQENLSHLQWGIKHPVLIASIERIFDVFPQAQVVHIVRDGRDVCLSYQQVHEQSAQNSAAPKFGPKGPFTSALYWIDGLRRVQESQHNQAKQLYELRYEDMLSNPTDELKRLCKFLNVAFTESLYQNYQNSDKNRKLLLQQHSHTIHAKVRGGIDSKNKNKFLTQMSRRHRFIFELIALPYLKKYNYLVEFPLLDNFMLNLVRTSLYGFARAFNNWRYNQRDVRFFSRTLQQARAEYKS